MDKKTIFWHRRDLRLKDNAGLYHALKSGYPVVPIFIFDWNILEKLEDRNDQRVSFIHHYVHELQNQLEEIGSTLVVKYGKPENVWPELLNELNVKAVYTNHDYEPYAIERDQMVCEYLASEGIAFKTFKDQCVFERDEVVKKDGNPYTVFTPYCKSWKEKLKSSKKEGYFLKSYPTENYFSQFHKSKPLPVPTLSNIGFAQTDKEFPKKSIDKEIILKYEGQRNFPAISGTTRLSAHLRFGTISIRQLAQKGLRLSESWLNELIWRDFYMMILYHFPEVVEHNFRRKYDAVKWRNDESEFQAWCEGRTGYPIVDAGMRELNSTGFMHNRVRMIVASFLTKHLLVDWRWGESYFAEKLLDYELASNNGGWQWAAGTGTDAQPYFRVFNPYSQTDKFDPELKYIRKWVSEFQSVDYPKPIVDHKKARERAISAYKEGLK